MGSKLDDLRYRAEIARRLVERLSNDVKQSRDEMKNAEAEHTFVSPQYDDAADKLRMKIEHHDKASYDLSKLEAELESAEVAERKEPEQDKSRWYLRDNRLPDTPDRKEREEPEREEPEPTR
jgi:hypothetical protein